MVTTNRNTELAKKLINPDNTMLISRKEGAITMLKRKTLPKHFIVFDTESNIEYVNDEVQIFPFRLGVAIYIELDADCNVKYREVIHFKTDSAFMTFIETYVTTKAPLYLLAHNFGFDARVLMLPHLFEQMGYKSEPPIINDRVFIWELNSDKGKIIVLDTANFGVISVEQLGNDLHFPKKKVDFDSVSDSDLFEYCENDVLILERFMCEYIRFIHQNDLGMFRSTLASQSLTAWRTSFMEHNVYIHNYEKAIILERAAYHGGRVECFWIGKRDNEVFYKLDVNSMYPYVMKHKELPCELKGMLISPANKDIIRKLKDYYVIAKVILKTNNNAYPYISKNKLIFPIGQYETVLHDCEFRYALEQGDILEVLELAYYTKSPVFEKYIDFFYDIKVKATRDKNVSWRFISKLFLVSLYGKFGQQGVTRNRIDYAPKNELGRLIKHNIDTNVRVTWLSWFGDLYEEKRGGESYYSSPSLAGAITAEARFLLYQYVKIAGYHNCFYVDTDSLIVNQQGKDNLDDYIDSDKLGYLKLEETATELEIFNSKDYRFGEESKTKGISKNAKKLSENSWECLQFSSFTAWLTNGGKEPAQAKKIVKRRISLYDKGVIIPIDNNDNTTGYVVPITLLL